MHIRSGYDVIVSSQPCNTSLHLLHRFLKFLLLLKLLTSHYLTLGEAFDLLWTVKVAVVCAVSTDSTLSVWLVAGLLKQTQLLDFGSMPPLACPLDYFL